MSVERQRSRIVASLVLTSLAQDTCLLFTNVAFGFSKFFGALGHSFHNYSRTFAFLFNDQARKYQSLTGNAFSGDGELGNDQEGDE